MLEEQMTKVATGLAFIVPAIFILRWFLTRKTGSPDEWVEYHIKELEKRYARGEIDEETYQKRLAELKDS